MSYQHALQVESEKVFEAEMWSHWAPKLKRRVFVATAINALALKWPRSVIQQTELDRLVTLYARLP